MMKIEDAAIQTQYNFLCMFVYISINIIISIRVINKCIETVTESLKRIISSKQNQSSRPNMLEHENSIKNFENFEFSLQARPPTALIPIEIFEILRAQKVSVV